MMRQDMLLMDTTSKQAKDKLKLFVKHRVGVRGDKVFWGKLLRERVKGDMQRAGGRGGYGDGGPVMLDESDNSRGDGLNNSSAGGGGLENRTTQGVGLGDRTIEERVLEDSVLLGRNRQKTTPQGGGLEDGTQPEEGLEDSIPHGRVVKKKTRQGSTEYAIPQGRRMEAKTAQGGGGEVKRSLPQT